MHTNIIYSVNILCISRPRDTLDTRKIHACFAQYIICRNTLDTRVFCLTYYRSVGPGRMREDVRPNFFIKCFFIKTNFSVGPVSTREGVRTK